MKIFGDTDNPFHQYGNKPLNRERSLVFLFFGDDLVISRQARSNFTATLAQTFTCCVLNTTSMALIITTAAWEISIGGDWDT